MPVSVALVANQSGQVLAKASVPVAGTNWKEYKFEMQSGNTAASSENHLELTIDRPGRFGSNWFRCFLRPITIGQTETASISWKS